MLDIKRMIEIVPLMVESTKNTMVLAISSLFISFILAVVLAVIRDQKIPVLNEIAKVYISFFRGTPLLVQLYLIYFGLGGVVPWLSRLNPYTAIIAALSLNMSAYMSETLRGAVSSVEKGQLEAALSIGLTRLQAFRRIVFPQAFRVALPSLANSFVDLIKGSSVAFTIGVRELMSAANLEGAATYQFLESFTVAALIYWVITIFFNFLQKKLEGRLAKAY